MSDIADKTTEVAREFVHRMSASHARCEASPELQKKYGRRLDALRTLWEANAGSPLAVKAAALEDLRALNKAIEAEAMFP